MNRRLAVLLACIVLLPACRKRIDAPLVAGDDRGERERLQRRSLRTLYYRAAADGVAESEVVPPAAGPEEMEAYRRRVDERPSESSSLLDELYGESHDLGALALRDSDGDGIPDFRVSDYFGKFLEGDLDVDGDGIRNVYDSHPFDAELGGRDGDGDGVPDIAGTFVDVDRNGLPDHVDRNGLPDHVDWGAQRRDVELAAIQLALFRDHAILLVERDAEFDLRLARAVDDALRLVFGAVLETDGLAALRTVAVERVALLDAERAASVEDNTSAQMIVQTQSLVIYDEGRATPHDVGLFGLLVHELGHAYQFSLDYDVADLAAENRRTDFPAPRFRALVESYGWQAVAEPAPDESEVAPLRGDEALFQYAGITEPTDLFWGETPAAWGEWLLEIYASLDESPDYLADPEFVERHIVGDYSLTTPWEWHSDNLLAYALHTLEATALASGALPDEGADSAAGAGARRRFELALRSVWPGFRARNIEGAPVLEHLRQVFPIAPSDRDLLVERYLVPAVDRAGAM